MNIDTLCLGCMENDSGEPICPKCGSPFAIIPANPLQLPPRTMLRGQYLIGRVLGDGASGIVYLAWDTALQARVAIKEFLPKGVAERAPGQTQVQAFSPAAQLDYDFGLASFLEQARALKKFSSQPNIVPLDTVFRENGTAYLVMEYLDGMTLEEFLRRRDRTISFESALRILLPVMDALNVVHAESILHGDISPASVFLCKTGKVKLTGFGFSKKRQNQRAMPLKEGYAPEELYRPSGVPGPASDVYGTAATLYRAITGKVPASALDRLAEDQLESPSTLGVAIPASAESVLLQALSPRAAGRFQSMSDFKSVLTGSGFTTVANDARIPPPQPLPPPPPRRLSSVGVFPLWSSLTARLRAPKRVAPMLLLALLALASATAALHYGIAKLAHQPEPVLAEQQGASQTDAQRQKQIEPSQPEQSPADQTSSEEPAPDQPQVPVPVRAVIPVPVVASVPLPEVATVVPAPPVVATVPTIPLLVRGYDSMLAEAEAMIQNSQYSEAAALLTRAVQSNPARWQAYNSLAKVELYFLNKPTEAFGHYRAALARGGFASFYVQHDHGSEQFSTTCSGWLSVSRGKASFKADDTVHTFGSAPVKEAKKNRLIGRIFSAQGKTMHAFHIRLMNHQNFNFAPTSDTPNPEADFIVGIAGI
jgi:serine/threonine protein kinase